MPCFRQEKSLEFCLRRNKKKENVGIPVKPYWPRAIKFHGLFSMTLVQQHQIVDDRWTPQSLADQVTGMVNLLNSRIVYSRYLKKANLARLADQYAELKNECADGRLKLRKVSFEDNLHEIRNYLTDHRDMQRLYRSMPIHIISDNINQRTFVMRKERDRLQFALKKLKQKYRSLLVERAKLENLLKYDYVLEEELASRILIRKIEGSHIRLMAIRSINTTYRKMVQVLLQDELFYEPILHSLDTDIEDQVAIINHILYLGAPAIAKFQEIGRKLKSLEENSRRNLNETNDMLTKLKSQWHANRWTVKNKDPSSANPNRYQRMTKDMETLKSQLASVEQTIKNLKMQGLCSQAKEIYPGLKARMVNNLKLDRLGHLERLTHESLSQKMDLACTLKEILVNNLSEAEENRLDKIKTLRRMLAKENTLEKEISDYIINRANAYILLRIRVWSLMEVLRHVDRNPRVVSVEYPNSYLKLPLLKFDLFSAFVCSPLHYEENVEGLMKYLKRKVYLLMKHYNPDVMGPKLQEYTEKYHNAFLAKFEPKQIDSLSNEQIHNMHIDAMEAHKIVPGVPNRKQIKNISARLVEEASKRQES